MAAPKFPAPPPEPKIEVGTFIPPPENVNPTSEAEAIMARQAFEADRNRQSGGGVAILPGGKRHRVRNFVGARYTLNKQAIMLGQAELILTDDFLREHQGWKFEWPVGDSDETRMYLKNGYYKAVPPEAVRRDVDFAIVGDSLTVQGSCVSWKRHILVAVPYEVWHDRHVAPADYAIERTATGQNVADELNSAFGGAGYRAEVEAFKDPRPERIS